MKYRKNFLLLLGTVVGCGGATTTVSGGNDSGTARGPTGSFVADGGSGPGIDAHPGGTTSGLPCGSATCSIPAESCCVIDTGSGPSYSCVVGPACPSPDAVGGDAGSSSGGGTGGNGTGDNNGPDTTVVTLQCGGAANCAAGTVCCATSNDNATSSACQPTCGPNDTQLCDPAAAVTGCPMSQPCVTRESADLGLPRSFGTCGQGGASN